MTEAQTPTPLEASLIAVLNEHKDTVPPDLFAVTVASLLRSLLRQIHPEKKAVLIQFLSMSHEEYLAMRERAEQND